MPDLQWKKLKEIVDQSDNIVFFGGAGVSRKAESLIFAVRTVCTIRNTVIRPRRF